MIVSSGLGTTPSNSSLISTGVSVVGGTVAAAASAGLLTTIGITSAFVPVIGPIIAGATLLIAALGIGNGCGSTCTEATTIANNAENAFEQNLQAAQQTVASNGCLTSAELSQVESNYQTIYNNMIAGCQQIPAPGGPDCVKARQPGGQYYSAPDFLAPLQAMPVCNPVQSVEGEISSLFGGLNPLLIIGGGLVLFGLLSD